MSHCFKLLLAAFALASTLDTTISCSCGYMHEQTSFCFGAPAFTFKVVAEEKNFPKIIETWVQPEPVRNIVEQYDYPWPNEEVYEDISISTGEKYKPVQNNGSETPSLLRSIVNGNVKPIEEVDEISIKEFEKLRKERQVNSTQNDGIVVNAPIHEIGGDQVNITEIVEVPLPLPERIVTITEEVVPQFETTCLSEMIDWSRAEIRYQVEDFKLYQGQNTLSSNTSVNFIDTAADGAMCGVRLTVGATYAVIGGNYYEGRLHMSLCDSYTDISHLNPKEREILQKNFAHRYAKGCKSCKIAECRYNDCEGQRNNNECDDSDLADQDVNYTTFQTVCSRRKSRCRWIRGSKMIPL